MRVEAGVSHYYVRRRRKARARRIKRIAFASVVLLLGVAVVGGIVYAGSPDTLARGIQIDGVDVGGLSASQAQRTLEQRFRAVRADPVIFTANGETFRLRAADVGLSVNWAAAVSSARSAGDGFGPVRGFRRIELRLFGGQNVTVKTTYDEAKLSAALGRVAAAVDRPHREASLVLRGLRPVVLPARTGHVLDRDAAARAVAAALSSFERGRPVALPFKDDTPKVTAPRLARAAANARLALSKPVTLTLGPTRYRVPRWRIAQLLELPRGGATRLEIAGPAAEAYIKKLAATVNTPAKDAQFVVVTGGITIKPSVDARVMDGPATAKALLAAALSPVDRTAKIVVATQPAKRTTEDAKAMGITGVVGSYTTVYGGVANRLFNVQLVAQLIDNTLIPPGRTFSFNGTTGERGPDKGFKEAPVIINGELQTALGGGVCQVSTTVFNAAYEAGLNIAERVNHGLYISHYPLARDATVNYPDTDLKFVNDTDHWMLLRTFVGAGSLTVNLYGTPQRRRVESETTPLRVTGPAPVEKIKDPELERGKTVVEETGSPSLATSVIRRVYDAKGKLLYENTWYSSYRGEKGVVRVGTKKPEPKAKTPAAKDYRPLRAGRGAGLG